MQRIVLIYGVVSGLIVIVTTLTGIALSAGDSGFEYSMWLGYLTMLLAFSLIFVGIRQFRDQAQGGVISFGTATRVGISIAAVAGLVYVTGWEMYLAMTDYGYIGNYAQSIIDARIAAGISEAELSSLIADMDQMKAQYANPLFRLPITFTEIFPMGLVVSLISAAVLRKSDVLPDTE